MYANKGSMAWRGGERGGKRVWEGMGGFTRGFQIGSVRFIKGAMKIFYVFLCMCVGLPLVAWGEDLSTLTGQTYANISVQRYDWEGIFIKHAGGISKIYYNEIPAEMRDHYKKVAPLPIAETKPEPEIPIDVGPGDVVTRTGQVFRNVSIRKTVGDFVTIYHDGGVAQVPLADLPEDMQAQLKAPPRITPDMPVGSNDLVSSDGQIYRNIQVRRIEPDGLTIQHDAGLSKVLFPMMTEEIQKKYEYDPKTAAAYKKIVAAAQARAKRDQMAVRANIEAARTKQIASEPIRVFDVRTEKRGGEYHVLFSVRNYDDKPRTITATAGVLGIKKLKIPANSSQSGLEVVSKIIQPTSLTVRSDSYSTQQILDW